MPASIKLDEFRKTLLPIFNKIDDNTRKELLLDNIATKYFGSSKKIFFLNTIIIFEISVIFRIGIKKRFSKNLIPKQKKIFNFEKKFFFQFFGGLRNISCISAILYPNF